MQLGVQYLGPKGRDYYGGIVVGEGYEVMSNTNTKRVWDTGQTQKNVKRYEINVSPKLWLLIGWNY